MDPDMAKRRQSLKVIISEAIMVVAVVITVVILGFLVSGYWLNANFEVERQGLLQVSSFPTGADVYIDGESSWLQRTNTSKVLSAGEHTITLTKDGYDSWSRTITISEGLLYRLHYPRLFLQNTTSEAVLDTANITTSTISPDGAKLLMLDNSMSWHLVNLTNDQLKPTTLEFPELFPASDGTEPGYTIASFSWSEDSSRVLVSAQVGDTTEWVLLDLSNPSRSLNLAQAFGTITDVQILDRSASRLLAIKDSALYQLDIADRTLSPALAENVISYNYYDSSEVIFSASVQVGNEPSYYVGTFKLGDSDTTKLLATDSPALATISKFYDDKYITILEGFTLSLYRQDDFSLVAEYSLSFAPTSMTVGHGGEFIAMQLDSQIATLDMEANSITEWLVASPQLGLLDSDMYYVVDNGELVAYDFDGQNRRIIARNVSPLTPVAITSNKWLYYYSGTSLMRQVIAN